MFRDAMPNGFAWEVMDVYSGCVRLAQHVKRRTDGPGRSPRPNPYPKPKTLNASPAVGATCPDES